MPDRQKRFPEDKNIIKMEIFSQKRKLSQKRGKNNKNMM